MINAKRPVGAKALIINAFALAGRIVLGGFLPQGVALGYVLLPLRGVLLRFLAHPLEQSNNINNKQCPDLLLRLRRGRHSLLLYAFQYSQFNLIVRYYHSFSSPSLIPPRSNPFKYKQMLILFINPLLLRLYIRKPKE